MTPSAQHVLDPFNGPPTEPWFVRCPRPKSEVGFPRSEVPLVRLGRDPQVQEAVGPSDVGRQSVDAVAGRVRAVATVCAIALLTQEECGEAWRSPWWGFLRTKQEQMGNSSGKLRESTFKLTQVGEL